MPITFRGLRAESSDRELWLSGRAASKFQVIHQLVIGAILKHLFDRTVNISNNQQHGKFRRKKQVVKELQEKGRFSDVWTVLSQGDRKYRILYKYSLIYFIRFSR